MNDRVAIVVIFSAICIRELWMLMPESGLTFTPFPFSDVEMTKQTYIAFACYYASTLMIAYAFSMLVKSFHEVVKVWFYLQAIEFVDYFLTYNEPWGLGIGITIVKFTVLGFLTTYKIYRCKI